MNIGPLGLGRLLTLGSAVVTLSIRISGNDPMRCRGDEFAI
jgi:hypothetical protein